ncbi:rCG56533 [Rattus norvegicus]|uniref:RCG56533 n=1 Tax=Rattus norvegicus TaxID=10116 RepID=A6IAH5_RAT|nr:rCG56533 [Rattus norvegicus]
MNNHSEGQGLTNGILRKPGWAEFLPQATTGFNA